MSTTMLSPVTALTQLHIDINYPSPGTARMTVVGEVDLATAHFAPRPAARRVARARPRSPRRRPRRVTFVDCTGVSALVAVRNAAVQSGRQMRITQPNRSSGGCWR